MYEGKYEINWIRVGDVGWVCVTYEVPLWSEPFNQKTWWPIDTISLSDAKSIFGDFPVQAKDIGNGMFAVPHSSERVRLLDGDKTKPIYIEEIPIPPPKTKMQVKYNFLNRIFFPNCQIK